MKEYDFFISHASEDKEAIARPLANSLTNVGFNIWYDEFSLEIGDSLSNSIDKGLAKSNYGIVVLSPNFFRKKWTQKELAGLVSMEMIEGGKVIIPIWHQITAKEICSHSPSLADKKGIPSENIDFIISSLIPLVIKPKWKTNGSSSQETNKGIALISSLAYCFLGLQDIMRLNDQYPEIKNNYSIKELFHSLIIQAEILLQKPEFENILKLYERPKLEDFDSTIKITMCLLVTLDQCNFAESIFEEPSKEKYEKRIGLVRPFVKHEVQELIDKVIELKVFSCKYPHFPDLENDVVNIRNVYISQKYWDALKEIIFLQIKTHVSLNPHPLTRYIKAIQERISYYLEYIDGEIIEKIDILIDALLGGDPDVFCVEEWINSLISEIENLFNERKAKMPFLNLNLTDAERVFFIALSNDLSGYNDWMKEEMKRLKLNFKN